MCLVQEVGLVILLTRCYRSISLLPGRQPDTAARCVHRLPGQVVTLAFGVKHTQKSIMHCEMISCNLHRDIESEGRRSRLRGFSLVGSR